MKARNLAIAVGFLISTASAASDREALEALYEALGGTLWENSSGWLTEAPLNELTGSIPNSLARVSTLKRVIANNNQLYGSLPNAFTNSRKIHLNVKENYRKTT